MLLYSNIPCLQSLQEFRLEFVATDEFSTRVGGVKIGANHINGVSLSLVLRMSLGQPIIREDLIQRISICSSESATHAIPWKSLVDYVFIQTGVHQYPSA